MDILEKIECQNIKVSDGTDKELERLSREMFDLGNPLESLKVIGILEKENDVLKKKIAELKTIIKMLEKPFDERSIDYKQAIKTHEEIKKQSKPRPPRLKPDYIKEDSPPPKPPAVYIKEDRNPKKSSVFETPRRLHSTNGMDFIEELQAKIADFESIRIPVLWFADQMELKLKDNDYKGGWDKCTGIYLMGKLLEETIELKNTLDQKFDPKLVVEEAIDVANFAMMIADKYRIKSGN
jgi:hypothetical protein